MPRSNLTRKAFRKRQTRLNFGPVSEVSSPTNKDVNEFPKDSKVISSSSSSSCHLNVENSPTEHQISTFKSDHVKEKLSPARKNTRSQAFRTNYHTYKNSGLKSRLIKNTGSSDGSESDNDDSIQAYQRPEKKAKKNNLDEGLGKISTLLDSEDLKLKHSQSSEDEIPFFLPRKHSQKNFHSLKSQSHKNDPNFVVFPEPDDHPFFSSPSRSQALSHQKMSSPLKRRRDATLELDSDSDILLKTSKLINFASLSDNESDESEDIKSSTRRVANQKLKVKEKKQEGLLSHKESSRGALQKHFTRQQKIKKHRTKKEKAFELMKRKRAGEDIDKLTSSESTDVEDSDHQFEVLSIFEDEDEELTRHNEDDVQDEKDKQQEKGISDDEFHENDSDFVVEDEGFLGVPNYMNLIPLHLTHAAHKPLKEHFCDAVEWMVKNKICSNFVRDDEIYLQAFRKLDDICLGLAKSKFVSTQWTQDFTRAIWTRPYFISGPLVSDQGYNINSGVPKCDACNHRRHIPTSFIELKGPTYNKYFLVNINQNLKSEEEDHESTNDSFNRWFVGSTCKRNAQYSHNLIHWRFALNEWVVDALSQGGYLSQESLAERDSMEPSQVDQYANQLIDTWQAEGIIQSLYGDWKNQRTIATVELTKDT